MNLRWQKLISNYKVGFQITSKKGAWIYIDTLTLTKKASDSAEETPAPEATESPDPTATPETSATPEPESNVRIPRLLRKEPTRQICLTGHRPGV